MKISVVIPCYEMFGQGVKFLENSLEVLSQQTFRDFEVVISDNSQDNKIKNVSLAGWNFPIHYSKNKRTQKMSGNTNNGILKATGEYVKILFQDDYLSNENALHDISNYEFDWLVTACSNHDFPDYSPDIKKGKNTIGSPSVLAFRNNKPLLFNEELNWVMDLDYYERLHQKYGPPVVLNKINVVIGEGEHQVTYHLSNDEKLKELQWLWKKYF